jgi:hypothetical protein
MRDVLRCVDLVAGVLQKVETRLLHLLVRLGHHVDELVLDYCLLNVQHLFFLIAEKIFENKELAAVTAHDVREAIEYKLEGRDQVFSSAHLLQDIIKFLHPCGVKAPPLLGAGLLAGPVGLLAMAIEVSCRLPQQIIIKISVMEVQG